MPGRRAPFGKASGWAIGVEKRSHGERHCMEGDRQRTDVANEGEAISCAVARQR